MIKTLSENTDSFGIPLLVEDESFVLFNKLLYRGLNLQPLFPGDKVLKFDKKKLNPVNGFYGYGVYFSVTPQEAEIWGNYIVEYKPIKPLKLWKEPKTNNGINIKRKDYILKLSDVYDGILFGDGAEGGRQIILRDPSLVKIIGKVK